MKSARLSARWHGHAAGSLIHGRDAEVAVAAGRAEFVDPPPKRKVRTGSRRATTESSPTRETLTEEHDDDDRTGDAGT